MPDPANTEQPAVTLQFERTENFASLYANNIFYAPSAWDLKIIFGQVEQVSDKTVIKQHLAVTIPWPLAKLTLFWLRMQVDAIEEQVGKIQLRKDVLPQEIPPLTPEQENDPQIKKMYDIYLKARREFLASLEGNE